MSSCTTAVPKLSNAVLDARQRLTAGREKLKKQHRDGSLGIQVCSALTSLLDDVLVDLYEAVIDEVGANREQIHAEVALVPYGGYGRRDMAPFSDIDLMILHVPGASDRVTPVVRRFTQHIVDAGMQLGYSVRTIADACELSQKDASIFTSLAEARLLHGSEPLFEKFCELFRRQTKRRRRALLDAIETARREERRQYGETNYLLEPNVKRSRGALRDIQLIRWVGFVRCGEVEPENLVRAGVLSKEDYVRLLSAREFLLRLRNELHFHANKANDALNKGEQLRIAELLKYPGSEAVRPVEAFMKEYFEHTSEVRYAASNFVADSKPVPLLSILVQPFVTHRADGDFRVSPTQIGATRGGLRKVCSDPAEVLRLMELANLYDKRIEHRTWSAIREAMMKRTEVTLSREAVRRFLDMLSHPPRLAELLRRLHELRVLEKIIPGMSHARCLLQFNEYHRYTVDEHTIRTIEACTEFVHRTDTLGEVYREIKQKHLLHLALLIHDLGKGYAEEHCIVGERLAEETCRFLGMPERDTETVKFLVLKHLLMSHLAQWRDTNDPKVIVKFAVDVGSPEVLKLLYVLTCADLAGVGPGVLNDWKLRLLTELYERTLTHIGGESLAARDKHRSAARREEIRALVKNRPDQEWWEKHVDALPASYLFGRTSRQAVEELDRLCQLPHNDAIAWGSYLTNQQAVEYTVGTYEEITPGIFHKLTGALSSKGLRILSAEINTLGEGLVLDRFFVMDDDYNTSPPPDRLQEVSQALVAALKDTSGKPPTFPRRWAMMSKVTAAKLSEMPTQVHIDNNASDTQTLIDVYTIDRLGLLYTITRTLFELGLSVSVSKIGTHLDQVVDVFYVTGADGKKVQDEAQCEEIRQRLMDAIQKLSNS